METRSGHETDGLMPDDPSPPVVAPLRDVVRAAIVGALEHTHGRQTVAAHLLGISTRSLTYKMKQLGIPTKQRDAHYENPFDRTRVDRADRGLG